LRPKAVGKLNSLAQNIPKYMPWELLAGSCNCTTMNRPSIRPKATAASTPEELAGFIVNALALSTTADGKD
jgi:hypothetical protein